MKTDLEIQREIRELDVQLMAMYREGATVVDVKRLRIKRRALVSMRRAQRRRKRRAAT